MTIDTTILTAALEGARALVQADGGDLELTGVTDTTVDLRLIVESAECAECVMPRQFLEQITLDMVRKDLPTVGAIRIDDPREPE